MLYLSLKSKSVSHPTQNQTPPLLLYGKGQCRNSFMKIIWDSFDTGSSSKNHEPYDTLLILRPDSLPSRGTASQNSNKHEDAQHSVPTGVFWELHSFGVTCYCPRINGHHSVRTKPALELPVPARVLCHFAGFHRQLSTFAISSSPGGPDGSTTLVLFRHWGHLAEEKLSHAGLCICSLLWL